MPIEGLDEEGLPKNPDLQLMQWRFLLTVDDSMGVNKEEIWEKLMQAVKENCTYTYMPPPPPLSHTQACTLLLSLTASPSNPPAMAPFYESLCSEVGRPVDSDLLAELKAANSDQLAKLDEAIEDSEKNFGETEQKEALQAKAEYLCRIGDKVRD